MVLQICTMEFPGYENITTKSARATIFIDNYKVQF